MASAVALAASANPRRSGVPPAFDCAERRLTKRSHAEYVPGANLIDMVKEDLIAERIAIDSYKEMIEVIGNDDTSTRRMLEWILSVEEEHADELAGLLDAGR